VPTIQAVLWTVGTALRAFAHPTIVMRIGAFELKIEWSY
jgi:hypothetical protein